MNIKTFCLQTSRIIAENPIESVPARISEYLPEILGDRDLLTADQKVPPAKGYGRHDVFLCPDDHFSIIAAVWPAGIISPIHDHKTWCTFGVYEGVIEETRYRSDPSDPCGVDVIATETVNWVAGDVTHCQLAVEIFTACTIPPSRWQCRCMSMAVIRSNLGLMLSRFTEKPRPR